MEQIHKFYREQYNISNKDWDVFASKLTQNHFTKKSLITQNGTIEKHLSFVEDGIVRLFMPKPENDLTFGFVFNNSFVSAYDSFLTKTPAKYSIEAITDTTLWQLTYDDLQNVYASTEIGELIGRKAAEDLFLLKSEREISLLEETAEQRYLNLLQDRPEVYRLIPLKYIASYIGVTPQALSRIRRRIS